MTIDTLTRETTGGTDGKYPVPQVEDADNTGVAMPLKGKNNAADSGIMGDSGNRADVNASKQLLVSSSISDGADVTKGTTSDGAWAGSGAGTLISILKGIYAKLSGSLTVTGPVTDAEIRASDLPVTLDGESITVSNFPENQATTDSAVEAVFGDDSLIEPSSGKLGVDLGDDPVSVAGDLGIPFAQKSDGELSTFDTNLEKVFGSTSLLGQDGKLLVQSNNPDQIVNANLYGTNATRQINLKSMATVTLQLFGTWAGTITFEATTNGGDWITFFGYNTAGGTAPVSTTTASGIFRFSVVGLVGLRLRYSTYTSGICQVVMIASAYPDPLGPRQVAGSAQVALSQRASTYELNTFDTTIYNTLMSPIARPSKIAPTGDTLQVAGIAPWAMYQPQIRDRMRVESGGSERLPFTQIPSTNEMSVQDIPLYKLVEKMYVQMTLLGQALMNEKKIDRPNGWEEM